MEIIGFLFLLAIEVWSTFFGAWAAYTASAFGGKTEPECWLLLAIGIALILSALTNAPFSIEIVT